MRDERTKFEKDLQRFYRFRDETWEEVEKLRQHYLSKTDPAFLANYKPSRYDLWIEVTPSYYEPGPEPSEVAISLVSDMLDQHKRITWRGDTLSQAIDLAWPEVLELIEIAKEDAGLE